MKKKVIAIYARKSKATDKGESLKVQIEKCKQLANYKFSDYEPEFIIYEEQEGKTGANLDREKFKELMNDVKNGDKGIDLLIVYKLDRLTRSVQDFTEIYELLNTYGTEFISVKEDFDTTSPMGRAMLTITVVFAQLEREVIAERIQDAMLELAKTGRWLGGMTPFAYSSVLTTYVNEAGQEKSKNHLEIVMEEAEILQKLFASYIEFGSLSKVETFLLEKNYRTRNDIDFSRHGIKFILSNPVYCQADFTAYEYFVKSGYPVYSSKEAFDGEHGIMAYNKTVTLKSSDSNTDINESRWRKKEDWIIALGEHIPLITSDDWIKVQNMLEIKKEQSYRASRSTDALLSGVLRCKCGHAMRPKTSGNKTCNGEKSFYYLCEMKEKSKGLRCQIPNIAGNAIDKIIIKKITGLEKEIIPIYRQSFVKYIKNKDKKNIYNTSKKDLIQSQIDKTKRYLDNISRAIRNATSEEAMTDFTIQYQQYLNEMHSLEAELLVDENTSVKYDEKSLIELLSVFDEKLWNVLNYEQKKYITKELIKEVIWDGKKVDVYFNYRQT